MDHNIARLNKKQVVERLEIFRSAIGEVGSSYLTDKDRERIDELMDRQQELEEQEILALLDWKTKIQHYEEWIV